MRGGTAEFDVADYLDGQTDAGVLRLGDLQFRRRGIAGAFRDARARRRCRAPDRAARGRGHDEGKLTGFVFKIQANMDPQHRDRIAFMRLCSGKYKRGMRMYHVRLDKEMRIADALTFMAADRQAADEAFAGDIIGLHNHGTINIGDTFTEGEKLTFTGIPNFAPEMFRRAVLKDPLKIKQLAKGLDQLCEEGATQLFKPLRNNDMILGAVGQLQFEVVAFRLQDEYAVAARVRHHRRAHRALGVLRRREASRGIPHQGLRPPRDRSLRRAGVPRAFAREPRAHHRALAEDQLPRDARIPVRMGTGCHHSVRRRNAATPLQETGLAPYSCHA